MELPTTNPHNREGGSGFAQRMLGIINGSALALLISVGHRTGLFDVMADRPPSTAEEIAEAAGLSKRYVRTWLEAMIKGGIVMHDPGSDTNELPAEHAEYLSVAGLSNLAALRSEISTGAGSGQRHPWRRAEPEKPAARGRIRERGCARTAAPHLQWLLRRQQGPGLAAVVARVNQEKRATLRIGYAFGTASV